MDEPRNVPSALPGDDKPPVRFSGPDDFPESHMAPAFSEAEGRAYARIAGGSPLVDVPGVGPRFVGVDLGGQSDRTVVGELPQPLRDYVDGRCSFQPGRVADSEDDPERDRLIINLLFAARNLTAHAVEPLKALSAEMCRLCSFVWGIGWPHQHASNCSLGHLEDAIEALFAYQQRAAARSVQSNPRKEGVTATLNTAGPDGTPAQCNSQRAEPPTAAVSALDQLARQLADEGAESVLESCTRGEQVGGVEWRVLEEHEAETIADELAYLEMRGVLIRATASYAPAHLVRIDWSRLAAQGGAR